MDVQNHSYGWLHSRFHWISWILSVHQLRKFHDDVELYTDSAGYEILIKILKLPYTKVHITLDNLEYDSSLWAVGKILTYADQNTPFLHIDGDIFVWQDLTEVFKNSDLAAQNFEITTDYYRDMWKEIYPHLLYLPKEMVPYHDNQSFLACNMGITGGNDIAFYKDYAKTSLEFVRKNKPAWSSINSSNFNIFFEQVLFHQMAVNKNKVITCLFSEISHDNSYEGFGNFHSVPDRPYLHLLGTYKRDPGTCKNMEIYTRLHYPEQYAVLAQFLKEEDSAGVIKTREDVDQCSNNFKNFLEDPNLINFNLLERDFYNFYAHTTFDDYVNGFHDFVLVKLPGATRKQISFAGQTLNLLEIPELNCDPRLYEIDSIDDIILLLLDQPITYSSFMLQMEEVFEDNSPDALVEFRQLLRQRLKNYITIKIISIS